MTIDITDQSRRVQYVGSGTGPYDFAFEVLEQTDIEVYQDDTLLVLTTDYTVSLNADGTGSVTTVSTMTGSTVTINGSRPYQRITDFSTGGDFFAATVNEELDSQQIQILQLREVDNRTLQAPVTDDPSLDMSLPAAADRLGLYLAFDASGQPVATTGTGTDNTLRSDLAASSGSTLLGFLQDGTGATARTAQSKNREIVSAFDFMSAAEVADVQAGTLAIDVAASLATGYARARTLGAEFVLPHGSYGVSSVTFDDENVAVRFEGLATLVGIATGATGAVLNITARHLIGYNFKVDGNFNTNYTSAVRWHSASAGTPAQSNKIFGLRIIQTTKGLIFGADIGGSPVDAAQSGNVIFGYTTRSVQVPFIGNQPNGFITLVAPILDCNPNEWSSQPGYNEATYQAAAYCFRNPTAGNNHLAIIGGELLKTTSTSGYGFTGGSFVISGATFEIAGPQGYIDGGCSIVDTLTPGAMTCGGIDTSAFNAFVIDDTASGIFNLRNFGLARPASSSVNSTANFIAKNGGSPTLTVSIRDCNLIEWRWNATVALVTGVTLQYFDNTFITVGTRAHNGVWTADLAGGTRVAATIYQNTSGKLRKLNIVASGGVAGVLSGSIQVGTAADLAGALSLGQFNINSNANGGTSHTVSCFVEVPNGHYYRLNFNTGTLSNWFELDGGQS